MEKDLWDYCNEDVVVELYDGEVLNDTLIVDEDDQFILKDARYTFYENGHSSIYCDLNESNIKVIKIKPKKEMKEEVNQTEMLKKIYFLLIDDSYTIDEAYQEIMNLYQVNLKGIIDEAKKEKHKEAIQSQIDELKEELKILQRQYDSI